jgi:hypothetical protein
MGFSVPIAPRRLPLSLLLIEYDLRTPGRDYASLIASIQNLNWCHHLKSAWLVKANVNAEQLAQALRPHIDANDALVVIDLTLRTAYWYGLPNDVAAWIQGNW